MRMVSVARRRRVSVVPWSPCQTGAGASRHLGLLPGPSGARRVQQVRDFQTWTSSLRASRDWLAAEGVTQVAMEATGVYWRPVWHVLVDLDGVELLLCNAHHVKTFPGARPMWPTPRGCVSCWSAGCCGAVSFPAGHRSAAGSDHVLDPARPGPGP